MRSLLPRPSGLTHIARLRSLPLLFALLLALPAWAQKVVILEIDGDTGHRLRTQIEAAVKKAGQIELLSITAYKDAAAKRRLKGAAAMTPVGVARVNKTMPLDAAVGGEVTGKSYKVVIWDRAGQELWTKELAVKGGVLSEDFATKLSRAIIAAAEQGAARSTAQPDNTTGPDETGNPDENPDRRVVEPGGTGGSGGTDERDTDLDTEGRRKKKQAAGGPPLLHFTLSGTTTWRYQCLRPGVASCREYDLAQKKPDGIVIDFTATVPYLGFAATFDIFPLARFDNRILQGFGLLTALSYGASLTRIVEETPQGAGPEKPVTSTDLGWSLQATWRYHFGVGYGDPPATGFVGARAGLLARSFVIDPNAGTSLPSSQRIYPTGLGFPVLGLDASVPVSKYFRIEAGVSVFVNPRPSPEQIIGYGNLNDPTGGATSSGWGFNGGFAGDIWGPLGWQLSFKLMSFNDRYYGQGQKWTVCNDSQCGGVAEELFTSVHWGVTASW